MKINYQLPIFGNIKIKMRDESAILFDYLDQNNEIRRMKHMRQLGILDLKYPCAHHSKKEYAFMLIHLIEIAKQNEELKGKIGLSKSINIGRGKKISSVSEILKCWSLLFQIGHLHGTFSAEKAMLYEITKNERNKQLFLSQFAHLDERNTIVALVESQNYFKISYVFMLWKLLDFRKRKKVKQKDKIKINEFIDIALYYLKKDTQARYLYSILRRIAFVLLDSYYCDAIFCLEHNRMTSDTIEATLKGGKRNNELLDLWRYLEKYLTKEIYKNSNSVFIENMFYRSLKTSQHKSKSDIINYIRVCLMQRNSEFEETTFERYLKRNKIDINQEICFEEYAHVKLRDFKLFQVEKSLDKLRKQINKNGDIFNYDVSINPKSRNTEILIFINKACVNKKDILWSLPFLLKSVIISQINIRSSIPVITRKIYKKVDMQYRLLEDKNFINLFIFVLKLIMKDNMEFVYDNINYRLDSFLYDNRFSKMMNIQSKDKGKTQEIQDNLNLANYLKADSANIKAKLICIPMNILIKSKRDNKPKTDIDSALIAFNGKKSIDIYLIQSKVKKQRHHDAKVQIGKVRRNLKKGYKTKILRIPESKASILRIKLI